MVQTCISLQDFSPANETFQVPFFLHSSSAFSVMLRCVKSLHFWNGNGISILVSSCISILFSLQTHSHVRSDTGTRVLTAARLAKVNYRRQPGIRQ